MDWLFSVFVVLFFGLPMLGELIIEYGLETVIRIGLLGVFAWAYFS